MTEESQASSSGSSSSSGGGGGVKFAKPGTDELILLVVALLFVIGFLTNNGFQIFFKEWWLTLAFLSGVGVLAVVGCKLGGVKLVDAKMEPKLIGALATLPVVGLLISLLDRSGNFWGIVMIVGTFLMGWIAFKMWGKDALAKIQK